MGWGGKEESRPGMSLEDLWGRGVEKRTTSFGVSPVGCLVVNVAMGVGAATVGAAAPGSTGSGDSVVFAGAWWACGISWKWGH